jgi:thiol-disulfide isomerase/thioredoxin
LQVITTASPRNTLAHYFLGQAYLKLKQLGLAKAEFAKAVSLARGTQLASQANNYLVIMANDPAASKQAEAAAMAPASAPEIARGKPTVLAFYATWADQCDKLDEWFAKGQAQFGNQVRFQKVDVDRDESKALVNQFKVGPIPTIVFLTADGSYHSALIGESSFSNISDALKPLLKR